MNKITEMKHNYDNLLQKEIAYESESERLKNENAEMKKLIDQLRAENRALKT